MRKIIYILFLAITTSYAQTKMSSSEANKLRAQVKDLAKTTKTITSDFIQYKHLDFLSNDIKTSGKLAFKNPDLVKWEYKDPFKYSVIFKKETLYINDEGEKSNVDIGSSKLFKQLNHLIIKSVKGDMFDDKEFKIAYFNHQGNRLVHFHPNDKRLLKYIKSFHITFNTKGEVVEVKMIEPSDDYTRIVFSNRIINKPLSDAIFAH